MLQDVRATVAICNATEVVVSLAVAHVSIIVRQLARGDVGARVEELASILLRDTNYYYSIGCVQ